MNDDEIRKRLTHRLFLWDLVNADSIAEMALPVVRELIEEAVTEERHRSEARKVIALHMVYPDGTHTGDCAGCRWDQGFCAICGDDHKPRCRDYRKPGDPEWTARELMSGLPDGYGHDCEHTSMQHGADGCNVPGCLCAFMSWSEDDYR